MAKETLNVTAIRPRDGQRLARILLGPQEAANVSTPVLQMIMAELSSLKQRVNELVVAQSNSIKPPALQLVEKKEHRDEPVPQRHVESRRLRRMFD